MSMLNNFAFLNNKDFCKHFGIVSRNCSFQRAFSTAEMLLVLLIVSFLILAMPPLVHKKIEKKVTRGQHGRYECWKDSNGDLYEYVATEKGGPFEDAMIKTVGTEKRPQGKKLEDGQSCMFKPDEYAPNAAFFSMQVIGGGAGGTYPPYENTTDYTNAGAEMTKTVELKYTTWSVEQNKNLDTSNYTKFSYEAYLNYYDLIDGTKWVKRYFPPVLNTSEVTYCSGNGHRGKPYVQGPFDYVIDASSGKHKASFNIYYGGIGGKGRCYTVSPGKMAIGVNPGDYYEHAIPDSYSGSYDVQFSSAGTSAFASLHKIDANQSQVKGYPTVADKEYISVGTLNSQVLCYNVSNDEITNKSDCTMISQPQVFIHAQGYAPEDTNAQKGTIDLSCTIASGNNGLDTTPTLDGDGNLLNVDEHHGDDIAGDSPESCSPSWSTYTQSSAKSSVSKYATSIFPSKISMKYTYKDNTTTFGYAGKSGSYASLVLPKIVGNLEIGIGSGGEPGTYADKKGRSGGNTVIWAKTKDVADSCNADPMPAGCRRILTAKGGLAVKGGGIGARITMLGADTCEYKSSAVKGKLHGCLDAGVATFGEAPQRFSVNSGFATIPEFDRKTNTPSAISETFGSSYLPGSGGDGGYSFITDNAGDETIKAEKHNNFSAASLAAIGQTGWTDAGTETVSRAHTVSSNLSTLVANYQCFNRGDDAVGTGGNGADVMESITGAYAKVCKPKPGSPGAVVIVW